MNENNGTFNALIEEKIANDSDFQASLADMEEADKASAISAKRTELVEAEWKSVSEARAKEKELADNYKTRAEKAEGKLKTAKEEKSDMSTSDVFALMKANVALEDIDEIKDYAALKKVSISEALNSSVVRTILSDKAEKRRTAEATATRSTRQAARKDGNAIMEEAKQKGEAGLPDPNSSDAEEVFWARRGGRRNK